MLTTEAAGWVEVFISTLASHVGFVPVWCPQLQAQTL